MALIFPGGPAGRFDPAKPTKHWDCAGDEVTSDITPLDEKLFVRLNSTAVGEALYVASCHEDKDRVWQWCLVTKDMAQHVYHGTAEQASNPPGGARGPNGARIKGVKSVAQWLGVVGRSSRPTRARSPPRSVVPVEVPPTPAPIPQQLSAVLPLEGSSAFNILAELIISHTYTQRDSAGEALGPTRDGLLEELDHLHYLCDSMGTRSPPKRTRD